MQFLYQLSKLSIYCFLLLLSNTLLAQKTFVEGYYISNDGDTIKGYIQEDRDLAYRNQFIFSEFVDGSRIKNILVDEAISFKISDFLYERISIEEKDIYARQLIDGYLKLYKSYLSLNEIEFYIKYKEEFFQLEEVENSFYHPEKGRVRQVSAKYKNILNYVFKDCSEYNKEKQLRNIKLKEVNLIKAITDYNYCIDPEINKDTINKKRAIKSKLFLMAGFQSTPKQSIGITDINSSGNSVQYEIAGQGFGFGFNVEINSKETNRRNFSFITGLEYRSTSYEFTILDSNQDQVEKRNISIVQIPLLGKVNFSAKSPAFFDFGFNIYYRNNPYGSVLGTIELPITLGLGLDIKRFKIESRFESSWPTSSISFNNSVEYIRFLLSYRINKKQ